ncbi:hypothetical protein CALCODRAFT_437408, partial [Calocera cornea HHB12733]
MFRLLPPHPEASISCLRLLPYASRGIPVFLDGPVPRRDQGPLAARYAWLMLILFKPWRSATDLRGPHPSWEAAFAAYGPQCPQRFKDIMDNMQIMHECKDSRDDHFQQRR